MKNSQEYQQALAQCRDIADMVAALEVDYDRLEYLRECEEDDELDLYELEELSELNQDAGDCCYYDDALERILEGPLSVEVRSGWTSVGLSFEPEEFCLTLCCGGPAVRIVGELDEFGEPESARIEYRGWGTPWTELVDMFIENDTLLTYCRQFNYKC